MKSCLFFVGFYFLYEALLGGNLLFASEQPNLTSNDNVTRSPSVLILVPDAEGAPFWDAMLDVMKEASDDLGVQLRIERLLPKDHNRFAIIERFKLITSQTERADYFVSILQQGAEKELLDVIEGAQQKFLSINVYIPPETFNKLGQPREKYSHWLGHIAPNDSLAGKVLAEQLFSAAKEQGLYNEQNKISAVGISSPTHSLVGNQRKGGLMTYVNHAPEADLIQVIHSSWEFSDAEYKANRLMSRYKDISVLWAVNDNVALGALKAAKAHNYKPGKNIIIGGVDWSPAGIKAIRNKELEVSLGGHFLDGALAVILAHDHYLKKDFSDLVGVNIETEMNVMNYKNVLIYANFIEQQSWASIDFRSYSRYYVPQLTKYSLNVEEMLILK